MPYLPVTGYTAPELIRNSQLTCSEKSDIYSFGIIFYELVTLKSAWEKEPNYIGIVKQLYDSQTPDLSALPAPLHSFVQQCLFTDPAQRPTFNSLRKLVESFDFDDRFLSQPRSLVNKEFAALFEPSVRPRDILAQKGGCIVREVVLDDFDCLFFHNFSSFVLFFVIINWDSWNVICTIPSNVSQIYSFTFHSGECSFYNLPFHSSKYFFLSF